MKRYILFLRNTELATVCKYKLPTVRTKNAGRYTPPLIRCPSLLLTFCHRAADDNTFCWNCMWQLVTSLLSDVTAIAIALSRKAFFSQNSVTKNAISYKLYVVADENGETKSVVYTQVLHSIFLINSMLTYGMLWYFNISGIPYHITGLLFSLHIFKS